MKYYCQYCGQEHSSVRGLTSGWCNRHPEGSKNHHSLYEGSEKNEYTCKYCGIKNRSIRNLTSGWCNRHPKGANKGHHVPAL
jgi:DNA-directed RNA polymerase subunit RPC12/RpoP